MFPVVGSVTFVVAALADETAGRGEQRPTADYAAELIPLAVS
jgi:hypothetical protein